MSNPFPRTRVQLWEELSRAEDHVRRLKIACSQLEPDQISNWEFEAVVPQSLPNHIQGISKGKNLDTCIAEAREKSRRSHARVYVFIILPGGSHIALNARDHPALNILQQNRDAEPQPRVCWSKDHRGNNWLLTNHLSDPS